MEVSGANMGVGDNGGNVGSGVPRPCPPSLPRPRPSTLPLPLPQIGWIRIVVDDTRGLMNGPREVDASLLCPAMRCSSPI